MHIVKVINVT